MKRATIIWRFVMSIVFPRSMRSLNADSFRGSILGLFLVAALLVAWFAWFFLAQVAVYEVADTARLEVDTLGRVGPRGGFKVVADFPPAALGRIQPGQPARLRLHGFPWTQYGSVPGAVARVEDEIQDGSLRVELALHPDPASAIPLQEGLLGSIEVEVDHVSPARLVLRAAGQRTAR
jgi:multidrug resistance efflux pump